MAKKYLTQWQYKQLIGEHFNELEVVGIGRGPQGRILICRCSCGKIKEAGLFDLEHGRIKSCGHMQEQTRHGQSQTRIWSIWEGMRQRCDNPHHKSYPYYGGRGIKICDAWDDFEAFMDWAKENGYQDDLTIDRIESWRGYEPDNCRWVPMSFQNRRKENVIKVVDFFEVLTLNQLADRYELKYSTVYQRYKKGLRGRDLVGDAQKKYKEQLDQEIKQLLMAQ